MTKYDKKSVTLKNPPNKFPEPLLLTALSKAADHTDESVKVSQCKTVFGSVFNQAALHKFR